MRLLDLFCGGGGASAGYARVFDDAEIFGIDTRNMPRYPYFFRKADAMTFPLDGYDLIHASPPCYDHTPLRGNRPKNGTGWMLEAITERLAETSTLWVVENVGAAHMPDSPYRVMLCGSMFGLDVRRHRRFATSFPVDQPKCCHHLQINSFPTLHHYSRLAGGMSNIVGVHGKIQYHGELEVRRKAMEIDWMSGPELAQSIPPAYCAYIAEYARKCM